MYPKAYTIVQFKIIIRKIRNFSQRKNEIPNAREDRQKTTSPNRLTRVIIFIKTAVD